MYLAKIINFHTSDFLTKGFVEAWLTVVNADIWAFFEDVGFRSTHRITLFRFVVAEIKLRQNIPFSYASIREK